MSQEHVEAFKRAVDAYSRRDVEALLETLDPEIEWHPALQKLFQGEATVDRGHAGFRELARDLDSVFAEVEMLFRRFETSAIESSQSVARAPAARTAAPRSSRLSAMWRSSGNGKGIRFFTFLDVQRALEAAGLRE